MNPDRTSETSDATTVTNDERNAAVQEWLFTAITSERMRQDATWGEQNHADDYWLGIFVEEVGEVAKAVIERNDDELTVEVIHAMAVLCGWMEARNRRWFNAAATENFRSQAESEGVR